jgi:hypothetical protein
MVNTHGNLHQTERTLEALPLRGRLLPNPKSKSTIRNSSISSTDVPQIRLLHPRQNEPAIQIGKRALSPAFRQSVRETWRIAGVLHAADQPADGGHRRARGAYSVNGLDLALFLDDYGDAPTTS